jgi:hypothetical protein
VLKERKEALVEKKVVKDTNIPERRETAVNELFERIGKDEETDGSDGSSESAEGSGSETDG